MGRSASSLLRAQAQAASVLVATLDLPGVPVALRRANGPLLLDEVVAGTPATIVRPVTRPPWPAVVFVNGAAPDGRAHPKVLRLSLALARSGHLVLIPDLPGIAEGELSPATLAAAIAFTRAAGDLPEAANGLVALTGVSVGASLALLVAADSGLANRISTVAAIAPYSDLAKVMLLATTGRYRAGERLEPYPAPGYLGIGLARSLAAILPATPALAALCAELRALDRARVDPLAMFRDRSFDGLGDDATRVVALLANRDPARFDDLFAALPAHVRAGVDALSPLRAAGRLRAPVEIATAPLDTYFPVAESRALVHASPQVRLTITSLLAHATPRLSPRYVAELGRLNGLLRQSARLGRWAAGAQG